MAPNVSIPYYRVDKLQELAEDLPGDHHTRASTIVSIVLHHKRSSIITQTHNSSGSPRVLFAMRVTTLISTLCAAALASATQRTTEIYIQPIDTTGSAPQLFAEIAYDTASLTSAEVISYEAPDIESAASLVRIGIYDFKTSRWVAGTTAASVDNFGKGYAPNLLLSVDSEGEVSSVTIKGVRIDAGQTRDFGPQAVVIQQGKGKQPELNKPVVLSPEGRKVEEEAPKSFIQK